MRVYVVGSFPREPEDKSPAAIAEMRTRFENRCRAIGQYLASQGHEFVIGGFSPNTADFHVIEGVKAHLTESPQKKVRIHLVMRNPLDGSTKDQDEINAHLPPGTFSVKQISVRGSGNQSRLIFGLNHSDVALLIGGGNGTFTTGIAAVAMKHPTLALPQFGGAADRVWQILVPHYVRGPFSQKDIDELSAAWTDSESPPAIATALRKILKDNPFNQKIELNQLALSATSLLCVALWILLFVETGTTWLSPSTKFFLLAGLATALGSTTRNIVRCYFDQEVKFSLGCFVTEFVLGVVVAFVFFLLMQLGGVIVSGSTVPLDMKDLPQFQRLVTATSLLCFAASYLIESSLDRLRSKLTRVLDETGPSQ